MAVLHIAEGNSPLFMTTLSLDILHPRSVEYNKSIMQIIAFLIKKVGYMKDFRGYFVLISFVETSCLISKFAPSDGSSREVS